MLTITQAFLVHRHRHRFLRLRHSDLYFWRFRTTEVRRLHTTQEALQLMANRYQQLIGCSAFDASNTTDYYARYTTSVICNTIVQNSITPCGLSGSATAPLCADSCVCITAYRGSRRFANVYFSHNTPRVKKRSQTVTSVAHPGRTR